MTSASGNNGLQDPETMLGIVNEPFLTYAGDEPNRITVGQPSTSEVFKALINPVLAEKLAADKSYVEAVRGLTELIGANFGFKVVLSSQENQ